MPQMAPINWLSLFIMFSIIFMIFNMMNFYMFNLTMPKSNLIKKIKMNSLNWKW
uniref:ATP synthase complex subunit 8 n=1 Tax=Hamaxiella brunnescens TaxID=2793258 RepID=A0A7T4X9R2_9MUSC|nr:ATP synthase F0 subunit 8 [Hamaxiella brunnescens]QQD89779.1 ATP synthase F0 subunit 8 [Hamaxiella brunnescens]